ncbi:MAG: hypothetical protein ACPIGG_09855, partial [Akkermansiaceae bacterium]
MKLFSSLIITLLFACYATADEPKSSADRGKPNIIASIPRSLFSFPAIEGGDPLSSTMNTSRRTLYRLI